MRRKYETWAEYLQCEAERDVMHYQYNYTLRSPPPPTNVPDPTYEQRLEIVRLDHCIQQYTVGKQRAINMGMDTDIHDKYLAKWKLRQDELRQEIADINAQ